MDSRESVCLATDEGRHRRGPGVGGRLTGGPTRPTPGTGPREPLEVTVLVAVVHSSPVGNGTEGGGRSSERVRPEWSLWSRGKALGQ